MTDKFDLTEAVRNIINDLPPIKDQAIKQDATHYSGDIAGGAPFASFVISFDLATGEVSAGPEPLMDAGDVVRSVQRDLKDAGFASFADMCNKRVDGWRKELAAIQPKISAFDLSAAAMRRRSVRSTVEILFDELARTFASMDRALYCGCPHCIGVKLPQLNMVANHEQSMIAYLMSYEEAGRWRW